MEISVGNEQKQLDEEQNTYTYWKNEASTPTQSSTAKQLMLVL
jgi:hypothetical protein